MKRNQTIVWRVIVLGLFAGVIPLGLMALDWHGKTDAEAMLDVSVSIRSTSHVTIDKFGDSVWRTHNGSGFLVSSKDCEVWTNEHVVSGAALIEVYPRGLEANQGIRAELINATPRGDVAILKLDRCDDIAEAVLGDSDQIQQGDESYVVGNPLGHNPDSISRGIISHTERYRESNLPYLQTDAAINPGSSGGALFDREGRVIGISTAIDTSPNGTNLGIGYALPINMVKRVVHELRKGPPSWGDAGLEGIVSGLTPEEASVLRVPDGGAALVVVRDPESGPGHGKLRENDVIFRIAGKPVDDTQAVLRRIGHYDVGENLSFELIRDGERMEVDIELGEGWQAGESPAPDEYDGFLGMTFEMWDEEEDTRGIFKKPVITKVHSLGPAHRARISSTQRSVTMSGPFVVPYLLDVKTVTGLVYEGEFYPVDAIDDIEAIAAIAYKNGKPLLLRVEYWARSNPRDASEMLSLRSTAFYKLTPQRALVDVPDPLIRRILSRGVSRPPFEFTQQQANFTS